MGVKGELFRSGCWVQNLGLRVWMRVVEEVGERYGELLGGWWIDDAITGARG